MQRRTSVEAFGTSGTMDRATVLYAHKFGSTTRNAHETYPGSKTNGPKVNFTGNVTALRQHIKRTGGEHYEVYHAHCAASGIDVHATAVPDAVKYKSGGPQCEQQLITNFVEAKPETVEWDREGLLDLIVRFVVETDQVIVQRSTFIDVLASFRDADGHQYTFSQSGS